MKIEIRKNRQRYNAGCLICGRVQDNRAAQPFIVYHKGDNEGRGHQDQVCSMECAEALVRRIKEE